MKILDAFFKKKEDMEEKKVENVKKDGWTEIQRVDGSLLKIKPKYDVLGNRIYRTIYDDEINEVYNFERYDVMDRKTNKWLLYRKNL